ncbi:MAG: PAS domain S-box-containing protein [Candidatus Azotimanducaceae bacterium]|jgi:PAS domain S-box-containing protein
MSANPSREQSVSTSLHRVILGIGSAVLVLTMMVAYVTTVNILEQETLLKLELLMNGQSTADSEFAMAEDNISRLRDELLLRMASTSEAEAEELFNTYFAKSGDGLWRVRPEYDDHTQLPSLYLQHDAVITPSVCVRAVASYQLLKERGPALVPPYYSVYMDFVERGLMVFSPNVNWGERATLATDNHRYPTMDGSNPENNSSRSGFWTPIYFDAEAQLMMVSVIEPLDWKGGWVGTLGHDIELNHLLEKAFSNQLDGSYNIILGIDGQLIMHPDFTQQIENSKGALSLGSLNDSMLTRINGLVSNAAEYPTVIADPTAPFFYGVAKIKGPEWLLVTVYPTALIGDKVLSLLMAPAIVGALILLLALLFLDFLIQRMVIRPLNFLDSAIENLVSGVEVSQIPIESNDEFGRLARSFESLTTGLKERGRSLAEAQNDWQRTFNTVPELIVILDSDLNIKQANQSFLSSYGLLAENVMGQPRRSLLGGSELASFEAQYNMLMQSREIQVFQTFSSQLSANFDVTLVPLFDAQNDSLGIVEVTRDVTENRRLEDQLRQSQKMDAIGHLAGGVAHDFNNLLQIILGYTETLEPSHRQAGDDQAGKDQTAVDQILSAATKAASLTQQLLAFGRRQVLQSKLADVSEVVGSTLKMIERLIEASVNVIYEPASERLIVNADANQLEQVMINLCLNSRDAMPEGGRLNISVSRALPENVPEDLQENSRGYVHICVRDDGEGIDPRVLDNIFEPFFSTKEKNKGTGLGLATAYGIIQQHGGTIKVASTPGEGTQFSIYLPLIKGQENLPAEESGRDGSDKGRECLLVAEDDEIIRELLVMILERAGYELLTATDGADAIRVYEMNKAKVQLLVLDVMMPELSGTRVMQKIREERPDIPCLLASGYSEDLLSKELIEGPNTSFITKPFKSEALLREVRLLLDHQTSGKLDQN